MNFASVQGRTADAMRSGAGPTRCAQSVIERIRGRQLRTFFDPHILHENVRVSPRTCVLATYIRLLRPALEPPPPPTPHGNAAARGA